MKKYFATILLALSVIGLNIARAQTTQPSESGRRFTRTRAAIAPATLPLDTPAPRAMTPDYGILNVRSIFMKGNQIPPPVAGGGLSISSTQPSRRIEAILVFNGTTKTDDHFVAFFEDTSAHQVLLKHDGDTIANGKINNITLDGLDYQANGKITHVGLGQNLDGEADTSLATQAPGTGSLGPTSGPSTGGDSVLERLRRRRQQGL